LSEPDVVFVRPQTLGDALLALDEPGSVLLGGGTATATLLKNGFLQPERLVWIGGLRELAGIRELPDGGLAIGSATTLRELHRSPAVKERAPAIADAARRIGNPRVRAVATVGGALVHGDPRQDLPPVLLAHRAVLALSSSAGSREAPVAEFFLGFMETAIEENEVITGVTVPSRAGWRDAYVRYTPGSDDDYPTVGVAVSLQVSDGAITDAEIGLGGVDGCAIRATEAAESLVGTSGSEDDCRRAARLAADACSPTDDQRGSASYKTAMVDVWTRRALLGLVAGQSR
jgi:carbon-monoxide dehydrogenase medium subunit